MNGYPAEVGAVRIALRLETGKVSWKLPPIKDGLMGLGESIHSLRFPPRSKCWKGPISAGFDSAVSILL